MNDHRWEEFPKDGPLRAWGTGVWPYTFVITQQDKDKQYFASAQDARDLKKPFERLGGFDTLQAAQEACRQFFRSKIQ